MASLMQRFYSSICLYIYSGVLKRDVGGFDGPNGRTLDNMSFNNAYYQNLVGEGTTVDSQIDQAPNWQQVRRRMET